MAKENTSLLDMLGIRKDHQVCLTGIYPALNELLRESCNLTNVLARTQMDQLLREGKSFDRVVITASPSNGTNEVEDALVIRAAQLTKAGGLIYLFTPVKALGESFGNAVLKYYPSQNVRGFNTPMGPVMVTGAHGNPEEQK